MKCDIIATGIINAAKNIKLSIPLVVRLEGTLFVDFLFTVSPGRIIRSLSSVSHNCSTS